MLWQHKNNPDDPSLAILRRTAKLYAELPKKSMVLHRKECWETAAWDVEPSSCTTQLWRLDTCPDPQRRGLELSPAVVQQHLIVVDMPSTGALILSLPASCSTVSTSRMP